MSVQRNGFSTQLYTFPQLEGWRTKFDWKPCFRRPGCNVKCPSSKMCSSQRRLSTVNKLSRKTFQRQFTVNDLQYVSDGRAATKNVRHPRCVLLRGGYQQ